jgi:type III pantothenate kinase
MHLVLDVGNTEIALGIFKPGGMEVEAHWRISTPVPRTADEYLLLLRALLNGSGYDGHQIGRAVLGSVVPSVTEVLRTTLERLVDGSVFVVDASSELPIRLDVEEPLTVGADRIVNTLASSRLYERDTITVDLGTATTFDCITADGTFIGGVIAPGILAGQEWLSGRTAKLPRVEFIPPARVIGRRTETCLHSGIFYSAVDAIDGIVRRIRNEWERPDAYVVATGGFAPVIGPYSTSVERVEPLLTLYGLQIAGEELDGSR